MQARTNREPPSDQKCYLCLRNKPLPMWSEWTRIGLAGAGGFEPRHRCGHAGQRKGVAHMLTQHVREKFSCRSCETITQPPAPFHVIARGFAGTSLLAMILVEKYANHQPLNRQSEQYAREGIELSVSTMADHVGACAAALMPLYELIKAHVFAAERIHGDDTTVPVLAKVKCRTGRLWTYVRDDQPFRGAAAPAAVFFYSPDRGG